MTNQTQTDWGSGVLNKLTSNGERIAVLEFKLDEFKQQTNERLDRIDNRLDNIENRLDTIEKTQVESDRTLQEINQRLNQNDTRLDDIEKIIKQLELAIKLLKWIAGGVGAILLSIAANYFYSFLN